MPDIAAAELLERIKTGKVESVTNEEAKELMSWQDSFSRLETLVYLHRTMQRNEWLKHLSYCWSICDNISTFRGFLQGVLGKDGPINEMMDKEEQAAFEALPDIVTIYRGCGSKNKVGASWTTDRSVAEKFPFLGRYRVKDPLLVTATVKKKNIIAVKLDRNEQEIITFSAKRLCIEPLTGELQ